MNNSAIVKKLLRMVKVVRQEYKLLKQDPKSFLYLYFISDKKKVHITKYDPKLKIYVNEITDRIHISNPELAVISIGSAVLGIAGRGDIDLLVQCSSHDFPKYINSISKEFGHFHKKRSMYIEWNFSYKNCDVELILIDPKSAIFKRHIKIFEMLSNDKSLLQQYEHLKLSSDNLSLRQYDKIRMVFFNAILRL